MRFKCTDCKEELEARTIYAGQPIVCPLCHAQLTVPTTASAQGTGNEADFNIQTVIESIQAGINLTGTPITKYMAEQDLSGGIELEDGGDGANGSAADAPATGEEGRYLIGRMVAQGGMGAILAARDTNLRRNVAMKIVSNPKAMDRTGTLRFIEEAQITGQLEHPGIVPLHELSVDNNGNVFFTMKFVKGKTLDDILTGLRNGDEQTLREYPLSTLLIIFQKVCDAIAFAHSRKVIHRDLKPDNIMIGDYGEVQVMDWGLAKVVAKKKKRHLPQQYKTTELNSELALIESVRENPGADVMRTMVGAIMGTPGFMAPEQALGKTDDVDERSDIYALGAILYDILTLHVPVDGDDLEDVIKRVSKGIIPHPGEYNTGIKTGSSKTRMRPAVRKPGTQKGSKRIRLRHCPEENIPDSLAAVAMKALMVDPWKRYQNVSALQDDIVAYQNGYATSAEHATLSRQIGLYVKRHKVTTTMVALILTLIFAGTATSITQWIKSEKARIVAERDRGLAREALSALKEAAPDLALLAQHYIAIRQPQEALKRIEFAIEMRPGNVDYQVLRGNILQTLLRLDDAARAYEKALKANSNHAMAKENLDLCREIKQLNGQAETLTTTSIYALYLKIRAQGRFDDAVATIASSGAEGKTLESFMQHMIEKAGIKHTRVVVDKNGFCGLDLSGTGLLNLPRLKDIPLGWLNLANSFISDISPLKGMPLNYLDLSSTAVSDLSPLKGMSLVTLNLEKTNVRDLSPLAGMPLTSLNLASTRITDLSQVKGLPLSVLNIANTGIRDLSPLKGMALSSLWLNKCPVTDVSPLKKLPLTDLSLRGVTNLDLSPLKDLQLNTLNLAETCFKDLSPLKNMPLARVIFDVQSVTNLAVFQDMTTLSEICNPSGNVDPGLLYSLLEPATTALKSRNIALAKEEATRVITDWKDIPAMSNVCSVARQIVDIAIPLQENPTAVPPRALEYAGHHYAVSAVQLTWNAARIYCETLGAHLATLTSKEETTWAENTFRNSDKIWIGGRLNKPDKEWTWVTGEKWNYTDWGPNEPSNTGGVEDAVELYKERMNDADSRLSKFFLIEWDR